MPAMRRGVGSASEYHYSRPDPVLTRAARLAGLNREGLYRQLSRRGNPSLASLNAVLSALGLKLRFAAG